MSIPHNFDFHHGLLGDVLTLRLGGDEEPEILLGTEAGEAIVSISPNGRWMAHVSDVSGERQIYVRPFPLVDSGGQRLLSDGPGEDPMWGPDGRELFYLAPDAAMVVPVETGATFQRGTPEPLFSMDSYVEGGNIDWDMSPDGQRFVIVKRAEVTSPIIVVQNWLEELKERVPVP